MTRTLLIFNVPAIVSDTKAQYDSNAAFKRFPIEIDFDFGILNLFYRAEITGIYLYVVLLHK